jgi:hypothetical protein
MLKTLCKTFVNRANELGMKGKARDAALIEFMVGACMVLHITKHDAYEHVMGVTAMVLTVRGFKECERIAALADEPEAAPTSQVEG